MEDNEDGGKQVTFLILSKRPICETPRVTLISAVANTNNMWRGEKGANE